MKLSEEQFDALKEWIERIAYVAAGSAINQPRARDGGFVEAHARAMLTEGDQE